MEAWWEGGRLEGPTDDDDDRTTKKHRPTDGPMILTMMESAASASTMSRLSVEKVRERWPNAAAITSDCEMRLTHFQKSNVLPQSATFT